jgi:hypothetical protein
MSSGRTAAGPASSAKTTRRRLSVRTETPSKSSDKQGSQASSSQKRICTRDENATLIDVLDESTESTADSLDKAGEDLMEFNEQEEEIQETPPNEQEKNHEAETWLNDHVEQNTQDLLLRSLHEPFIGWRHKDASVRIHVDGIMTEMRL